MTALEFWRSLSDDQERHLYQENVKSFDSFKYVWNAMKNVMARGADCPCDHCKAIAEKAGLA